MNGSLRVVLTPRAFADLTHIRDYLIERSPTGADNVRQAINTTLDHLSDHPRLGRDRPELGV
jgi:plasmid stabilization system protein ParE